MVWQRQLAHGKSGFRPSLPAISAANLPWNDAIGAFAHAEQNERDHETLDEALRAGKSEVFIEPE